MKYPITLFLSLFILSCSQKEQTEASPIADSNLYFPPLNSEEWSTTSPEELGWNSNALELLSTFLEDNNTRAFIILKEGKIVVEEYFGNNLLGTAPFNKNSQWYWASTGKCLTAALVGIAQEEGHLNIEQPTSKYLGDGWTNMPLEKEQAITVKNQLTMTTGLEYTDTDLFCTLPSCLNYKTDASQQWYYHNAPYTLLEQTVENATGKDYNSYTHQKIASIIGMNGQWIKQGYSNIYWSTARDMARFGLMVLNEGTWEDTEVLSDKTYYNQMIQTSQELNPSYGYLWWLNGKEAIMIPGLKNVINQSLSVNAPSDLIAGLGKNGQFLDIVPSEKLVVIRMGEAAENALVPITFHNDLWEKINLLINE